MWIGFCTVVRFAHHRRSQTLPLQLNACLTTRMYVCVMRGEVEITPTPLQDVQRVRTGTARTPISCLLSEDEALAAALAASVDSRRHELFG